MLLQDALKNPDGQVIGWYLTLMADAFPGIAPERRLLLWRNELVVDGPLHPAGASVASAASVPGVPTIGVAAAGEMRFAGVLPPEGTPTGKISVFSSRFFFGFGSGAVRNCQF